jgi:hypothetical protein
VKQCKQVISNQRLVGSKFEFIFLTFDHQPLTTQKVLNI